MRATRFLAILAACVLMGAPVLIAPALADGIEPVVAAAPRHRHRERTHHQRVVLHPTPIALPVDDSVHLPPNFFSGGGVGTDVGTGFVGGGGTTVIRGASATAVSLSSSSASASASASARSSASSRSGSGGHGGQGGGHSGGGGCGCH